jgi:exoribonuclease R
METYKIRIDDRNWHNWSLYESSTMSQTTIDNFNPTNHKLFTNDEFTYNAKSNTIDIIHSVTRINENIPAVLILENNKTYGRESTKKNAKLLYKCVPDDIRLPIFLVPYEIKRMGFSKALVNIYVTICYKEWTNKHPIAKLSQTIGSVEDLSNFYEYQLYCKSLNASIQKFHKDANNVIKTECENHNEFIAKICDKHPTIEDRTSWKTFTIDPPTSLDYDDGFSIHKINDNTLLSIYISNVSIWLDELKLWESFSQRISTIYLPDRKRPMLPTILSDGLCSLQANMRRFAFTIDIMFDEFENIISINYVNTLIKVFKNFAYEEETLCSNNEYKLLFDVAQKMSMRYKYVTNIKDSHDVVSYLMIFMNHNCANELLKYNNGIFRSSVIQEQEQEQEQHNIPDFIPENVSNFIKIWTSSSAHYVNINAHTNANTNTNVNVLKHNMLEIDAYTHITSPIRRIVDLLNIIQFQINNKLFNLSTNALSFYEQWIGKLDYINVTMRAIKKVQTDCTLLDMCYNQPELIERTYEGYCFDKLVRNDGLYYYVVFLPELKLTSRIAIKTELTNYDKRDFKLFLFNNEQKFKKKIRLHLC